MAAGRRKFTSDKISVPLKEYVEINAAMPCLTLPNSIISVMLGRLASNCREQEQGQSQQESFRVDFRVSRIFVSVRGNAVYESTIRFPLFVSSRCEVSRISSNKYAARLRREMTEEGWLKTTREKT